MNHNGFDGTLFRGIPQNSGHGASKFFTSLGIHSAAVGLLLITAPQIILHDQAHPFNTILIAPALPQEEAPPPKPAKTVVATEKPVPQPRPLHELAHPVAPRVLAPKLEQAPALPNTPRPEAVLPPTPLAAIRPAVQTGLFGSNAQQQAEPKLPVPQAREAGFDPVANRTTTTRVNVATAAADFDLHSTESRPANNGARIQTGAFGETVVDEPRSPRLIASNVSRAGFDDRPATEKPAIRMSSIRSTGFDEPKAANSPAKTAAPAQVPVARPVQILEKPKPVYTAEARAQKIEGAVVLDVVFAASGEVRVMGVVRGLGHGLDENAIDAARHIRFAPATQSGTPVDQRVQLHVVFQITG